MSINYTTFDQVLLSYLWSGNPLSFDVCPNTYHEFTALRHVSCGWNLFQELVWACSTHMNGQFRDFHHDIRSCLPTSQERIALYFQRVQDLSHEIFLSREVSGMKHELLHHFVHILSQNGDS
jgi:hypothetical protein